MDSETIIKVLDKLIGSVEPYGDSYIDECRLKHLKLMGPVLMHLISRYARVLMYGCRKEYSILRMSKEAEEVLREAMTEIDRVLKEGEENKRD